MHSTAPRRIFGRRKQNRPDFHTEAGIERRLVEEGRGQGEGRDYKPYITVQDFSSCGKRTMVYIPKLQRPVHFFSRIEQRIGVPILQEANVIEGKEQYPLPREVTTQIADALNVIHPRVYDTKVVVTTDLLITRKTPGGLVRQAIAIKESMSLRDRRVVEKLEIERAYHEAQGTEFRIMTEDDIHPVRAANWQMLLPMLRPGAISDISPEVLANADAFMRPLVATTPWGQVAPACDAAGHLAPGTAARIARYFMATEHWLVDMDQRFCASQPLSIVQSPDAAETNAANTSAA